MNEAQKTLSKKYLIYKFVMSLWFISAIWLFFYRIFMTDAEAGTLDAIAFAFGLLVEVPSGALADRFGRSRVAKIGLIMSGIGIAMQAIGGFWTILAFQIGFTAGQSLISGADDALFYDKLKFKEDSTHWRRLVTRGGQAALAAMLIATVMGGFIYDFNPQLTWILNGVAIIVAVIVIWSIKDESKARDKQTIRQNIKEYAVDIRVGFREFKKPKFRLYVPLIITIQGLFYASGMGILRLILIDKFTFSPFQGSIVIASCGIISIIVLHFMHKYSEKLREKRVLTTIALATIFGLVFSIFDVGWWGYVVILIFYVGEHALHPFMSEILNKQASPDRRSTVLSVASFLKILPYVALAPIIGFLNTNNSLEIFLICWAVLSALAWLYYFIAKKKDRFIKVNFEDTNESGEASLERK